MDGLRVGFIGLGLMGGNMARVLLSKGFTLQGYDLDPQRLAAMVELGAQSADSPAEVAASSDILCTSLPNGNILKDVYLGSGGALAALAPGSVIVDFSTTEPSVIQELHAAAARREVDVVDAPVSGGPPDIPAGKLVVLTGSSDEAFRKAEPVLNAIAGSLRRIGAVGDARVVKLVNNLMSMGNVVVAAEAFTLGVKAGVDPQKLYDVLSGSGGSSAHFVKRFPWVLKGDFAPRFAMPMAVKDVGLGLALAREVGAALPVAAITQQLYSVAASMYENDDIVAVVRLFESWAGTEGRARDPEAE